MGQRNSLCTDISSSNLLKLYSLFHACVTLCCCIHKAMNLQISGYRFNSTCSEWWEHKIKCKFLIYTNFINYLYKNLLWNALFLWNLRNLHKNLLWKIFEEKSFQTSNSKNTTSTLPMNLIQCVFTLFLWKHNNHNVIVKLKL